MPTSLDTQIFGLSKLFPGKVHEAALKFVFPRVPNDIMANELWVVNVIRSQIRDHENNRILSPVNKHGVCLFLIFTPFFGFSCFHSLIYLFQIYLLWSNRRSFFFKHLLHRNGKQSNLDMEAGMSIGRCWNVDCLKFLSYVPERLLSYYDNKFYH